MPTKTKSVKHRQKNTAPDPKRITVRLLGTVGDLGPERVFILTEGNIKDILEYLIEKEINFDRVIGVSAGACNGASYLSKQKGRNRKVNVEFPSDKRYMGFRHLIITGSYFNMRFIFEEIPNKLVPFDEKAFFKNPAEFDIITTSLSTGNRVILSKRLLSRKSYV